MWDIRLTPGSVHTLTIPEGYSIAALCIAGDGAWKEMNSGQIEEAKHRDFIVINAEVNSEIEVQAGKDLLRILAIQVPTAVNYQLHFK